MLLRALTSDELAEIKTAKNAANKFIQAKQKEIKERMIAIQKQDDLLFKKAILDKLAKNLEQLKPIKGRPVIVDVDGDRIYLDYDLLKKLDRNLNPRIWHRTVCVARTFEKAYLIIHYHRDEHYGDIELYELPSYQIELLGDLPIVDMKESD
ncbi:hypothetical protein [Thermicanus aegyptius]|uniref:hypothetical protein n=1 Tax=Thermicanus aegyptius TaxID=94009 RepID=UPI00040666F0|nr:hypothetical protein [Thermicanus aegyptius]